MQKTQSATACTRLWVGGLPDGRLVTDLALLKALNTHAAKSSSLEFSLFDDGERGGGGGGTSSVAEADESGALELGDAAPVSEVQLLAGGDALSKQVDSAKDQDHGDGESSARAHFLNRNYVYIQFDNPLIADLARQKLRGAVVQGRAIQVNWARDWS